MTAEPQQDDLSDVTWDYAAGGALLTGPVGA